MSDEPKVIRSSDGSIDVAGKCILGMWQSARVGDRDAYDDWLIAYTEEVARMTAKAAMVTNAPRIAGDALMTAAFEPCPN
jgi:hypothetical protein